MAIEINPEYQSMIDKINAVWRNDANDLNEKDVKLLKEVEHTLRQAGARPVLNDSIKKFVNVSDKITKLYTSKNKDYNNSFESSMDKYGLTASAIRINDKLNRFENLIKNKAAVQEESIEDTLMDLAAYSIMTIMWLKSEKCE